MTQTEQLLADLTANATPAYYPDGEDGDSYFDWSTAAGDGVQMEVGAGDDAVQIDMTRDQLLALQQRLTTWLLATA